MKALSPLRILPENFTREGIGTRTCQMTKQWSFSAPEGSDSLDDLLQMFAYGYGSLGLLSDVTLQCFAVLLVLLLLRNLYKRLKCGTSRHLSELFRFTKVRLNASRSIQILVKL